AGIGLVLVAASLRRRKRRAWQAALCLSVLVLLLHVVSHRGWIAVVVTAALVATLGLCRGRFVAPPGPGVGRWKGGLVAVRLLVIGVVADTLIMVVNRHELVGDPALGAQVEQVLLALVGVSGPVVFRHEVVDDLTATIGLWSAIGAVLAGGY